MAARSRCHPLPAPHVENALERCRHVGIGEFLLRHARRLEIAHVEEFVGVERVDDLEERHRRRAAVRHAEAKDARHMLRKSQGAAPCSRRAPIMAHGKPFRRTQRGGNRRHIVRNHIKRVGIGCRRLVRRAIAAHVRHGHAISRGGQGRHLMAPGNPEFRPAMHQDHQRSIALHQNRDCDVAVRNTMVGHMARSRSRRAMGRGCFSSGTQLGQFRGHGRRRHRIVEHASEPAIRAHHIDDRAMIHGIVAALQHVLLRIDPEFLRDIGDCAGAAGEADECRAEGRGRNRPRSVACRAPDRR